MTNSLSDKQTDNQTTLQKQELISQLVKNQAQLELFGIKKLGLFGSFVRNEQRADSDIDLLVEFVPGQKNFDNFMQLSFFLEDLFSHQVELVTP